MERERVELVARIKRAFRNVPFPNRKIGDKEELWEFLDKQWQEITIDDINHVDTLLFFSKRGLQYYLPAFLIAILQHPAKVSSDVKYSVLNDLGSAYSDDLCEFFTEDQKQVILEFFERYESFFPFPSKDDLPPSLYYVADQKMNERHEQVQEAVHYWKTCLQTD